MPATVKSAKPGRHADGKGLYLLVKPSGARSWVLRIQVDGKRRDVGLGTADLSVRALARPEDPLIPIQILHRKLLTLSEAREKAKLLRDAAKAGLDPVLERDRERRSIPKFRDAARDAHAAVEEGLSVKGAKTFISSLENHAFAIIGDIRVDVLSANDVTAVLRPIWMTKPDMARKVRQRINTVLNFAHGKGWRPLEAPGRSVTVGLPKQPKGKNYRMMPYADVPAYFASESANAATSGRLGLLFQILTAARPGEVRTARWKHIDLAKRDWNRPESLMKAGKEHTVTLNAPAIALLERVRAGRTPKPDDLIFPGLRGAEMSDMTMSKVLRTAKLPYDAHGFRSSFRNWAAEMTDIDDAIAEKALAHEVPNPVARAYKRTSYIDKRRVLLEDWGAFVVGHGGNV